MNYSARGDSAHDTRYLFLRAWAGRARHVRNIANGAASRRCGGWLSFLPSMRMAGIAGDPRRSNFPLFAFICENGVPVCPVSCSPSYRARFGGGSFAIFSRYFVVASGAHVATFSLLSVVFLISRVTLSLIDLRNRHGSERAIRTSTRCGPPRQDWCGACSARTWHYSALMFYCYKCFHLPPFFLCAMETSLWRVLP